MVGSCMVAMFECGLGMCQKTQRSAVKLLGDRARQQRGENEFIADQEVSMPQLLAALWIFIWRAGWVRPRQSMARASKSILGGWAWFSSKVRNLN